MIGSVGPRMLDITMPHAESWNVWFVDTDNSPAGVAPLRDLVDDACRRAGRDPSAVERTVAVQVRLPGGTGRLAPATGSARRRRWRARPPRCLTSCGPTPTRGSPTSSWSWDPITRREHHGIRTRPPESSPRPESCVRRDASYRVTPLENPRQPDGRHANIESVRGPGTSSRVAFPRRRPHRGGAVRGSLRFDAALGRAVGHPHRPRRRRPRTRT